eukprot:m.19855 g.19855  ORF g.19855 m.19855 type:complete len:73 (-) comp11958_c1_seq2:126-344(-)
MLCLCNVPPWWHPAGQPSWPYSAGTGASCALVEQLCSEASGTHTSAVRDPVLLQASALTPTDAGDCPTATTT